MSISTAQIIKKIGCDKLSLYKGKGYWYFVYDDLDANGVYDDLSIHCFKLNHMTLDKWVEAGKEFIDRVTKVKIYENY